MSKKSELERTFLLNINYIGLPTPEIEYRLHNVRQWRFDGAYPEYKIAYEIEGGVYSGGRHTRPKGFIDDCEKYNTAAIMGWKVLRFPTPWVTNGVALKMLEEALQAVGLLDNEVKE